MQDFEFFDILNHLFPREVKQCLKELGVDEDCGCDYIGEISAHLVCENPYILFDLTERLLTLTMPISSVLTLQPRQAFGKISLGKDGKTILMSGFASRRVSFNEKGELI